MPALRKCLEFRVIHFGRYQLDPAQGLTRGAQEVRLTPKSLCVLCLLAERAGHVVTKEELFRTVWPDTAVTDSALTSCIKELRHALHDDAHHPRFIETRHRRGYRFLVQTSSAPVPKVSSESRHDSPVSAPAGRTDTPFVGREAVLEQMLGACALAERGARQVLFVTGEPGIGKTTVVQALLAKAAAGSAVRTTWAQCIEHYGAGEPYQPLLEALTRLWRQPGGGELVSILERYAPTWLAQLPALLEPARLAALQRTAAGTTRNRMLRELIDAIEVITARVPLIVWLEDLHWSDASTLDWIATLAQRPEPAQLVLIGTFRRPAVDVAGGPIAAMVDALRVKGFSREIPLGALDEAAVADYAALRFPPAPDHEEASRGLARLVHQHTGGNPLFVVNVLGDLVGRGALVEWGGHWTIRSDLHAVDLGIPEDVRRMLERQVDRVPPGERALLEIASVAGAPFSAATVAAASGLALNDVEEILAGLARQRRFVRETGAVEWPDGTIAARFDFLHVLYRDVLYQRVPAGRRAELHRAIGACQEAAYGERATEIAAGLAMHFEKSRDTRRAVIYFHHAAENARRLSAYKEARMHFDRALALLESEPAGPERTEQEVVLRTGLGGVIMATRGWGAPEAEDAYSRARALCRELGETPRLFPALWGLWLFYLGRGPLSTASDFAQDLVAMARRSEDRALLLQAHHASWATAFLRGDLEAAREAASEGARLYEPGQHAAMAATYGNHDAGVCGRMFMARALTLLGRTDEAVRTTEEAIALARDLGHPLSLTLALVFAAADDQARRDGRAAGTHAAAAAAIARDQDFRLMLAWALTFEGWAAVEQGQEHGLERIDNGVAEARATGSEQFLPHLLGLLAETHLRGRRADAGLQVLDEALAIVQRTGERFYEAELHRLTGELHLVANAPRATHHAEEAFLHALDIARSQGAKLFQLRAAVSLGRLWERLGRGAEALTLVAGARQDIMAGVTLPDVIDADALLAG